MLDYRLVEAFAAVLEERGFERAALRLRITQSAVSQRVKQLEDELGAVLIVRESPPRATQAGERLLRHYRQVLGLEEEAVGEIGARPESGYQHLPLAVNTDSLAVWLLDAVLPAFRGRKVTFEILVEAQDRTLAFLKSGAVVACVSPQREGIQGCSSTLIGRMRYVLAASPGFRGRWFPGGFGRAAVEEAPLIHYSREDPLQHRALSLVFGEPRPEPPAHYLPSTEKYFEAIAAGLGYGLVPEVLAAPALASGGLVELEPRARIEVPLYWHRWNRHSALLQELTEAVLAEGARILEGGPA